METGSVSFHKPSEVMFIKIEKEAEIVKKLTKTKREEFPDLKKELEAHKADLDAKERAKNRALMDEQKQVKLKEKQAQKEKDDFFKM